MAVMQDLWHLYTDPGDNSWYNNDELKKLKQEVFDAEAEVDECLKDDAAKQKFKEYCDLWRSLAVQYNDINYFKAFALGAKLIIEVYDED
jgi:hypothetical protein